MQFSLFTPKLQQKTMFIDLYQCKVRAGFPSPADDFIEKSLDLNDLLIKQPAATFFVRVEGDSMQDAGIYPDDILVVDRSIPPASGKVVVCAVNGELTVKYLKGSEQHWRLVAANATYPDILLHDGLEAIFWGVVTAAIHIL